MRLRGLAALGCGFVVACSSGQSGESAQPSALPGSVPTLAKASATFGDPLTQISRVEGSTFIEILEVRARDDGMLLYCTGVRGLQIVDARDPSAMKMLAEPRSTLGHKRFRRCQHLAWADRYVYYTNRGDQIQPTPFVSVVDTTQSPPVETASFTKKGHTFEGIAAVGDHLFVAMHDAGLLVLQHVGDTLVERARLGGLGTAWGVTSHSDRLYVTDAKGGLSIVNIAKRDAPVLLGRVAIDGAGLSVEVSGSTAYVASSGSGVVIVDVGNPATPHVVNSVDTNGTALQVAVSGSRLVVANWSDVRLYDISDPHKPVLVGTETITTKESHSRVFGASVRGDVVFVGEWTGMYAFKYHAGRIAPDIKSHELRIDFDRVGVGESLTQTLTLENEGAAPLTISALEATGDGYAVESKAMTIAPGALATVKVTFKARSKKQQSGVLEIHSNDPDQGVLSIPMLSNRTGLGVGDLAPDIELSLVSGGGRAWKLKDQRGKVVVLAYFATF